jgi:hypothetical protein
MLSIAGNVLINVDVFIVNVIIVFCVFFIEKKIIMQLYFVMMCAMQ